MQQSSSPQVLFSSMPSTSSSVPPLAVHLNMLMNTLSEAPRDDVKFQVLKEISENLDELFGTSAYSSLIEGLICIFMRLLHETSPQFIAENNTLQLRKLMLELLFRLSSNDVVKSYSKSLQQILLRLIYMENEENALLIIKILTDHIKTFRPAFASELTSFFIQWKNAYTEMLKHTANESMFLQKPFSTTNRTIEESVVEALRSCYFTTTLTYSPQQQTEGSVTPTLEKYTLIPKANQSVKVLAEMSVFLLVLIQMHRQHLLGEVLDLIPIFLRYINIKLPEDLRKEKLYNRELVDEFHNSQVRALSFIGYTAKQSQIAVVLNEHTKSITDAILMLIDSFHPEVIIQRRELLMALKYLFQSEFKTNFITIIPKMCDEKALLGNSFTSQDQLRNQSYSLLADILHHVRMNIPHLLKHIFFLCSRCLHDHQLLPYVQTMYGKLMMNLIEPLIIQSKENVTEIQRLILCNAINSFLRKAKLIANFHLPLIKEKYNKNIQQQIKSTEQKIIASSQQSPSKTILNEGQTQEIENTGGGGQQKQEKASSSIEASRAWQDPISPLSLNDCKNLVRFIIQPIKMMVIALKEIRIEQEPQVVSTVERYLLELFPNGLICLDIFIIGTNLIQGGGGSVYQHKISSSNVRSKEEKETLDAFIAIYTNIETSSFERVLEQHMEFLIERITINPILQNICSTFLTNSQTMNKTGQILVKFLLARLPELGANNERATLYLKLFKLVFHAISCSSNNSDCDSILKPFLHQIIQDSMQYALEARESTNYFLLLRALFRSIGSGTHEQMYHQFLPLLPSILQQLNRLQNGSHLQSIHELFVELCLTVPVRLSSLLPYLPLLMDPLVCALNGSPTLVQQGLRTLELCVDNLQPEYFYDHMQPVRASLMKGLWHCVSHGDSHSSLIAFRILGKFGGSNRKILLDAQNIQDFNKIKKNEEKMPQIILSFHKNQINGNEQIEQLNDEAIECTVDLNELVNAAVKILRSQPNLNPHIQLAAASLLRFVLSRIFSLESFNFTNFSSQLINNISKINENSSNLINLCSDQNSRELAINALKGIFISIFNVETRGKFLPFFKVVIKYLTIHGIFEVNEKDFSSMDSLILIDVIAQTLSDPNKDYCHAAMLALRIIIDTVNIIYEENVEKICQFPLFNYLFDKITSLCYSCEWFSKLGGCTALRLIIEYYPSLLVQKNSIKILEACIQMISDLSNELSSGALDYSSKTIDLLLNVCFPNDDTSSQSVEMLNQFVTKLIDYIDDSDNILRKEIFRIISLLSSRTNSSLFSILKNTKESLRTKILEAIREFSTISIKSKIAGIDLFIFCSKIEEFNIDIPLYECMMFARNLLSSNEVEKLNNDDSVGYRQNETKDFELLRQAAIKALILLYFNISSYSKSISIEIPKFLHHQKQQQIVLEQIFQTIFENAINMKNDKLKEEACECISKIIEEFNSDNVSYINKKLEEIINDFIDKKQSICFTFFNKINFLVKYSNRNFKLEELELLMKDLVNLIDSSSNINIVDVECVSSAVEFFTQVNYLDQELLKQLFYFYSECLSIFTTKLNITWQNIYFSYLSKFSSDIYPVTIITKEIFNNDSATNFLVLLTSKDDATNFRLSIADNLSTLQMFADELLAQNSPNLNDDSTYEKFMLNFLRFLSTFFEKHNLLNDSNDFSNNYIQLWNDIIFSIRKLWLSETFQNHHSVRQIFPEANLEESPPRILDEYKFDVPVYCARIILTKLKFLLALQTTEENSEILSSEDEIIDLLYDLTFAFVRNYASDFLFLQQFIEEEIVPKISLSLRRATFFKVINLLKSDPKNGHSMHLVRFMQYIVAPSFSFAFDNFDVDLVVCGHTTESSSDSPTEDSQQQQNNQQNSNIVLVLCREIIQKATTDRTSLSHTLVIVMYLFCALFVQKCSAHIYDPSKRQQGNKQEQGNLRPFMLFGWPCLQQIFCGDLTEKYAGLFLIANIIDKFSINRTIVLQVLNSLIQAYQQDNKEMVRKSLDILIPVVTKRMTDGYSQLKALIKKVMIEESKNYGLQIIHCLQIIIRQYKVFYHIRHQMAQLILSSIQKLMSIQIGLETKRLLLEFCEVVIKWEQDRQQNLTNKIEEIDESITQASQPSTSNVENEPSIPAPPDLNKEMDKNFIDTIIMFLFRMATSTDQLSTSSGVSSALEQINRRALLLLRLALKPNIFGNVVTIRTNLFEKQLQLPNPEQFSTANETAINQQLQLVNITLDVFSNIIPHMPQKILLDLFRPLQRSLICCMSYSNSQQILRSTYNILGKLLDKTKNISSSSSPGLIEFDLLNQHISRCIHDAFNNYACSLTASPPMTVITLLRLMHSAQSNYLETVCLGSFVKLLQRLVREYVATNFGYSSSTPIHQHDLQAQKLIGDLLSICLELLCSRTRYFNNEAQKTIVQFVVIPLIEKGAADKIIENVIKIATEILSSEIQLVSESFQQQLQQISSSSTSIKIQSLGAQVLFKLFSTLETRLAINLELQNLYLNAIILLYENQSVLLGDGLIENIQPAFYWGLCCFDKEIRKRFFTIHERSFLCNLFNRLIYILKNERWDLLNSNGSNSCIAHIINLLLNSNKSEINLLKLKNCSIFCNPLNEEIGGNEEIGREKEEKIIEEKSVEVEALPRISVEINEEIEMDVDDEKEGRKNKKNEEGKEKEEETMEIDEDNKLKMKKIVNEIEESLCMTSEQKKNNFNEWIEHFVDLLYTDPLLCQQTFIELFTSIWSNLNENEREQITSFITPFLTSSAFRINNGKDVEENSFVACFLNALIKCKPEIEIDPFVLSYFGSTFKCWHIALLKLEKVAKNALIPSGETSAWNAAANLTDEKLDTLDSLTRLYQFLNEFDQYNFVWRKRACFEKTIKCLAFFQQGDFLHARETAEKLMLYLNEKLFKSDSLNAVTPAIQAEFQVFERCWIDSCKQLNDWSSIETFSNSDEVADINLLAETSWHLSDWKLLKDCLVQLDAAGNPSMIIKSSLYKLMLNIISQIANFDHLDFRPSKDFNGKAFVEINKKLIANWKKLPQIVSHSHLDILNYAHFTHEVCESANVLNSNLQAINFPSPNGSNSLNAAVKHLLKSWRSRPITNVDQLNSLLDLFTWRSQFFSSILHFYEHTDQKSLLTLPVHTLAQTQIQLSRMLRRSNQIELAQNELNKLHSSILVHPIDIHLKLVEHIKCLLRLSSIESSQSTTTTSTKRSINNAQDALIEALDLIEGVQLHILKRDQISRLMICKGIVLSKLDKREEAGRAFSAAAQLDHDVLGGTSVWKHWGDFLTNIFMSNINENSAQITGMQAIACTLEHARISPSPIKARYSIAKFLWLIKIVTSFGSEKILISLNELLEKYVETITPSNWLFWLNALLLEAKQRPTSSILNILKCIGKAFPQRMFYDLRIILGSKSVTEYLQKYRLSLQNNNNNTSTSSSPTKSTTENENQLISILLPICENNFIEIDALNKILLDFENFPISPLEELLNEFRQILSSCHFDQFTKIADLTSTIIDSKLLQKLQSCVKNYFNFASDFTGKDEEKKICNILDENFIFLKNCEKGQISLFNVASALRKSIQKLSNYLKNNMGTRRLVEHAKYLGKFKSSLALIDVFSGSFDVGYRQASSTSSNCNAQIASFLPIFEQFVRNESSVCRVIRLRSLNGKIYTFQLENVAYDAAKIHILQLFSLLNIEFAKSRHTAQRFIQFYIPQILHVGANSRLMECYPQNSTKTSNSTSSNFVIFADILNEMLKESMTPLSVVEYYYGRLGELRYSHKNIHELFNNISNGDLINDNNIIVKKDLLSKWMYLRYTDAEALWNARKKLSINFALLGLSEHAFFLSSMSPDGLVLDVSTAQLFFTDYKFDLTKKVCDTLAGKVRFIELDANRPVPFRLTTNISHFLDASIEGHLAGALIAIARSFNTKTLEIWLRPILWDVFSKAAEEDPKMNIVNPVKRAVDTVLNRIKAISQIENGASATSQLLMQAQLSDNLCRMDPSWHPWF